MFICFYYVGYKTAQIFTIRIPHYKAGCIMRRHNLRYFDEVASFKEHTQFKTRVHKPYPISDQNGQKTIPFGAAHTCIAHIRE